MDTNDPQLIDLYSCVYGAIQRAAPLAAVAFANQYSNPSGFWHAGLNPVEVMNRFFRLKLALVPVDTLKARQALEDGINPTIWLQNFERYVVAVLTRHVWS